MTKSQQTKASKFLSLVLRHKPEVIGLTLDENGWAATEDLLQKMSGGDVNLTLEELKLVVENNDKKRFVFSSDFSKIRANQGHSIQVDLALKAQTPPEILYHGTVERNLDSIKEKGLIKGDRNHVHLSADEGTAFKVGQRYGKPVILIVKAKHMHESGLEFYQSENGVWLSEFVPTEFIEFPA